MPLEWRVDLVALVVQRTHDLLEGVLQEHHADHGAVLVQDDRALVTGLL